MSSSEPVIKVTITLPTGYTRDDVEIIFVNADETDDEEAEESIE